MEEKLYFRETLSLQIKFGNHIRNLRDEYGWTQEILAEKVDISPRNLSDIENGKVNPHLSTVFAIATAFGMTISELFIFD